MGLLASITICAKRRLAPMCEAVPRRGLPVDGADALAAEARERLRVDWGETSADGRVTLEPCSAWVCAPVRRRGCSTGKSSAGSIARGSAYYSTRCGDHNCPSHLCAARRRRIRARRSEVERAIVTTERHRGIEVEDDTGRTGSAPALLRFEPMIEVATAQGRIACGPVHASEDIEPLFDAGFLEGGPHPLRLGQPGRGSFPGRRETRFTFARYGRWSKPAVAF